jgi:TolA-binding protein
MQGVLTHLIMSLPFGKTWGRLGGVVIVAITLNACGTTPARSVERKGGQEVDLSAKVQGLQRQVRERDKRIEELESQLNDLKMIEQDFDKRRKSIRTPATLTPIE